MLLLTITSWLDHREREMVGYLMEENRILRAQLGGRRLRLTDDDRRRLAVRAFRLGRPGAAASCHDRDARYAAAMAPTTRSP